MNQSVVPLPLAPAPVRVSSASQRHTFWREVKRAFAAALLPPFPGTKDITLHPAFRGSLSRAAWQFTTHRVTRSGLWFFGLTLVLMSVGSPTLEIQAYVPLLYATALWVIALFSMPFARPRVELKVRSGDRVRVGETWTVDIEVRQSGRRQNVDQVIFPWRLHPSIDPLLPDGTPVPALRYGESAHVALQLCCYQRGVYVLKGFRVSSDFPFGLINSYRIFRTAQPILVYPRFEPLLSVTIPPGASEAVGDNARLLRRGESFDLLGNREYRPGDNIRNIDWRATARLGLPILREWREEHAPRIAVLLDTIAPEVFDELDFRRQADTPFERAVSLSAAVCDALTRQDSQVELLTIGEEIISLAGLGGEDRTYQIMERLARAAARNTAEFISDAVYEPLLRQFAQVNGAVVLLLDWDESRREFVEQLRRRGIGVKVVLVRDISPTLPPPQDVVSITKADMLRIREI